jgi:hypothetical protein
MLLEYAKIFQVSCYSLLTLISVVFVGNKCDLPRKVKVKDIKYPAKKGHGYVETSIKDNFGYEKIFGYLLSKLLNTEVIFPTGIPFNWYVDPEDIRVTGIGTKMLHERAKIYVDICILVCY